jgi:hypothetical protein
MVDPLQDVSEVSTRFVHMAGWLCGAGVALKAKNRQ